MNNCGGKNANRYSVNRFLSGAVGREGGSRALQGEDVGESRGRGTNSFTTRLQNVSASNTSLKVAQVSRVQQSDDGKLSIFSQFLMGRAITSFDYN